MEISLTTPAILFPAISLLMLAYTNRFLALANLIRSLLEFTTQERFVYRHEWQVGDVLLWDNRCTLHRGTPFDKQRHIRHVHRTWVRGEVPR